MALAKLLKMFKLKGKDLLWSGTATVVCFEAQGQGHGAEQTALGWSRGRRGLPDPKEESVWARGPALRRKLGCGVAEGVPSSSSLAVPVLCSQPPPPPLHQGLSRGPLEGADACSVLLSPSRTAQEVAAKKTEPDIPWSRP